MSCVGKGSHRGDLSELCREGKSSRRPSRVVSGREVIAETSVSCVGKGSHRGDLAAERA